MSPRLSIGSALVLVALLAAPPALAGEIEWSTPFGDVAVSTDLADDPVGALDRARSDPVAFAGGSASVDLFSGSHEPAPEDASREESRGAPRAEREPEDSGLPGLPPVLTQQVVILKRLAPVADVPLLAFDAPAQAPAPPGPAPESTPVVPASAAAPVDVPAPVAASAAVVALASAAAVASTVAGSAGFDWERLRRFGFAALLYTRIAKDRLLDHGRRESLLAAVRDRPGSTLVDLAESTGIPRNTATYHLNRLEKEGFVSSSRQGRGRLYFAVGGEARRAQADAFAALRHDKGRALALAVGQAPGLDQQALCAKLGLTPSLVHWHADRLLAAGVLSKTREGRHVRYHPGPAYGLVATSAGGDGPLAC